jgi:ubiquinone/menaquinone biosynthesis C-methylase UbiE
MHRIVIPELLDTDAGTPHEIEGSLADLRSFNRYLGGVSTMTGLVREVAACNHLQSVSCLDVGGGNGELMGLTAYSLAKSGIQLQPVLLDRAATHMATPSGTKNPGTPNTNGRYPAVAGEATNLPLKDNSFDVVGCCLFLHHLEPSQVVLFVNEALRVARHAVLINDLIRHPLHLGLAYAGRAIYRSRLTRHDAVASVKRAYTVEEIQSMLRQTGTAEITVRRFFLFRMGVIAWKRPSTT